MHNQRLQQVEIVGHEFAADVSQRKYPKKISYGPFKPHQGKVLPTAGSRQFRTQHLHATARNLQVRMPFRKFRKCRVQLALQLTLRLEAAETNALYLVALGKRQNGG